MKQKKHIQIILALLMIVAFISPVQVSATFNLNLKAGSAILVDAKTGKILYKHNENEALPPASMTKMMSEYLIMEAIQKGSLKWDEKIHASPYAAWMGKHGGSRVYMELNKTYEVKNLYEAIAVASGNDATVAMAERISGTETEFVKLMNKKAKEFGMTNTHFVTSTGYPKESIPEEYRPQIEGEQLMSAKDAAILAFKLINDFPEILETSKKDNIKFENELFDNWNWMVPGLIMEYKGLDGLKTGYTKKAGYCFTGTAKKENMRLITVIMKADKVEDRFHETRKLLDFGFSNFEEKTVTEKGQIIEKLHTIEIEKGKEKEANISINEELTLVLRKGQEVTLEPKLDDKVIQAPKSKGEQVGVVKVKYVDNEKPEYIINKKEEVPIVLNEMVEKANFVTLFFRTIKEFITDLF